MNRRVSWPRVFVAEEARLKQSLPRLLPRMSGRPRMSRTGRSMYGQRCTVLTEGAEGYCKPASRKQDEAFRLVYVEYFRRRRQQYHSSHGWRGCAVRGKEALRLL